MPISTEFINAAIAGDAKALETMLDQGMSVDARDPLSKTALHIASGRGHLDIVKMLISNNADVNAKTSSGSTPLHTACYNGRIEIARCLLESNADVNIENQGGLTPLHIATERGFLEVCKILIEHSVHYLKNEEAVNASNQAGIAKSKVTPIILKIDIDSKSKSGSTPLHLASSLGNIPIVELLISYGADINSKDLNGYTPIRLANEGKHFELSSLLILAGARVEDRVTEVYGVFTESQTVITRARMTNGDWIDADSLLPWQLTQLEKDLADGDVPFFAENLQHSPSTNAISVEQLNKLHLAAESGDLDVVSALLSLGIDPNCQLDEKKVTPIALAARNGHSATVRLLIAAGADPNLPNALGGYPLHAAAANGDADALFALIEGGAIVNLKNGSGYSPMDIAAHRGHTNIQQLLKEHGGQ